MFADRSDMHSDKTVRCGILAIYCYVSSSSDLSLAGGLGWLWMVAANIEMHRRNNNKNVQADNCILVQ